MSKKVISILLSAAMLVAMLCVGVGAVTASADTVTYYFLAPDEYFATNNSVGYYYWAPEENGPWPGLEMTPAPEVGPNVFKCEAPDMDSTSTIIFNAFVDAGTPADPELAAHAHQTININTEGYVAGESAVYDELGMELENFYDMIYVLNNNDKSVNEFSGAATTAGEWFSIDPTAPNYYKNFELYYGSYNFANDNTDTEVVNSDTDTEVVATELHAGDEVTLKLTMKNVKHLTSFVGDFTFNPDLLGHTVGDYTMPTLSNSTLILNDEQLTDAMKGKFSLGNIYDAIKGTEYYAGEAASLVEIKCTVLADCNIADLALGYVTKEITTLNVPSNDDYDPNEKTYVMLFENPDADAEIAKGDVWTEFSYDIVCNHEPVNSDTDTETETDTDTETGTDTVTDTDTTTDTTTDSDKTSSVVTSDTDKTSDKDSDSDKKDTNDTASKTSSKTASKTASKTTTTTTVQTAGTFAVVSLVVILMAAAAVVLYTRKKTEE